jgi:hypothetical protein
VEIDCGAIFVAIEATNMMLEIRGKKKTTKLCLSIVKGGS